MRVAPPVVAALHRPWSMRSVAFTIDVRHALADLRALLERLPLVRRDDPRVLGELERELQRLATHVDRYAEALAEAVTRGDDLAWREADHGGALLHTDELRRIAFQLRIVAEEAPSLEAGPMLDDFVARVLALVQRIDLGHESDLAAVRWDELVA